MNPISNEPFEIVTTTAGAISIKCCEVNEIMHNPVGPWPEANALYIQPSRLKERLATGQGDFVVYDVGLGAAANALAALHVARANLRENASPRRLHLVSFERDLRLLEFALAHADQFEHFQGFETAIRTLLDERRYEEPGILWELHEGDFLKELSEKHSAKAHLIFFDPYSPKKNSDMWSTQAFTQLRAFCQDDSEGALLMTYSQATPIRVALLAAGFYVGVGESTGKKESTTQAATTPALLSKPLGREFLGRWERSQSRVPYGMTDADLPGLGALLEAHPQFNS